MEIPYIIRPHTIVCIHSKAYIKYTTLDLAHQKFVVRYTPHLCLKYTINRTVGNQICLLLVRFMKGSRNPILSAEIDLPLQ